MNEKTDIPEEDDKEESRPFNYEAFEKLQMDLAKKLIKLAPFIASNRGQRFAMWSGRIWNETTKVWEPGTIMGRFYGFFQTTYYRKTVESEKEQQHSYPCALLETESGKVEQVIAHGLQFMPQFENEEEENQ